MLRYLAFIAACCFCNAAAHAAKPDSQQIIMGWVEYVTLPDFATRLKAKLDTGATTSSMRAEIVQNLPSPDKSGKGSIIFKIQDNEGKNVTLQRPLLRWVRIKDKTGHLQRRPVVDMAVCVAGHPVQAEVNLAPREDFIYPILIGRNMLRAAHIIVDANRTFTAHGRCSAPEDGE